MADAETTPPAAPPEEKRKNTHLGPPANQGFTNPWIKALKAPPAPDRWEYGTDHKHQLDLRMRHSYTGAKTWGVYLPLDGRRTWIPLAFVNVGEPHDPSDYTMTVSEAQAWAHDLVEAHHSGVLATALAKMRAEHPKAPVARAALEPAPAVEIKTVRKAFAAFYESRILKGKKRRKRPEDLKRTFDNEILPVIGDLSCTDPTLRQRCGDLLQAISDRGSTVRTKHVLGDLKQFFKWARKRGHLDLPNGGRAASPVEDYDPEDVSAEDADERDRFLTDEELKIVWDTVAREYHEKPREHEHGAGYHGKKRVTSKSRRRGLARITALAIRFLACVPVRTGSLLLAQRSEIDWEARVWSIPVAHLKLNTETARKRKGRPVEVPLHNLALHLLRQMIELGGSSKYVVASPRNTPARGDKPARDEPLSDKALSHAVRNMIKHGDLELPGNPECPYYDGQEHEGRVYSLFTPHDLRRTGRTLMSRLHLDEDVAEELLGHVPDKLAAKVQERILGNQTEGQVRRRYNKYSYAAEMRATLDALGAEVERVTGEVVPAPVIQIKQPA